MNTQTFIELAIEGGWKPFLDDRVHKKVAMDEGDEWVVFTTKVNVRRRIVAQILLDPLAWQAVGKVKGWNAQFMIGEEVEGKKEIHDLSPEWLYWQHKLLDLIADGKSIEEALGEILK